MYDWFKELDPILQALLATLFTWFLTAAGAALVFMKKELGRNTLDAMLGMASGVMIAASFWSLLAPGIEMAEATSNLPAWLVVVIGFLAGGGALWLIDKILPHLHPSMSKAEGIQTSWKRTTLLVLAITLHNIPEGLAVGVAFGAAAVSMGVDGGTTSLAAAMALALGIGIQNFPEGTAVSMPMRREGFSRKKAFFYGQMSGMVEPIAGVAGATLVIIATPILPYALAFAAGAMIYVVVEELIPAAKRSETPTDAPTVGAMIGFAIMMALDVGLG